MVLYESEAERMERRHRAKVKFQAETALEPDWAIAQKIQSQQPNKKEPPWLVPKFRAFGKKWMGPEARRVWNRAFVLLCRQPPPRNESAGERRFREPAEYRKLAALVTEYFIWEATPRSERTKEWPKYYEFCTKLGVTPGDLKCLLGRVQYDLWKGRYWKAPTDEERLRDLKDLAYAKAQELEEIPAVELSGGAAAWLKTTMEQHGGHKNGTVNVNVDNRTQSLTVVNDAEMKALFLAAVEENKRLLREVDHEEVSGGEEASSHAAGGREADA